MLHSNSGKDFIFCIASVADKDRVQSILDVLQSTSKYYEVFYIDASKNAKKNDASPVYASVPDAAIVVFFASKNSVYTPLTLQLIILASSAHKSILTVYLEDCQIPEGLHLILDSYQAILWRPDMSRNAFLTNIRTSIDNLIANLPKMPSHAPFSRNISMALIAVAAIAIIGSIFVFTQRPSRSNQTASSESLSPEDYATWLDTTDDPSVFAEAFFDMAQIGGISTYQNLWDRFVAQKVKDRQCITEKEWIARWTNLASQGFSIVDRRVSSVEESDAGSYTVTIDLLYTLGGDSKREKKNLTIILEDGNCRYLDGTLVSTDYIQ